jgi:ferritin-like metal-binding protein YciE
VSDSQSELSDPADLFAYDLAAALDMETKLVDALDEMARRVTNDNLEAGFEIHRNETERQVELVEETFERLGAEPTRRDNHLVDGLLAEREQFDDRVRDEELRNGQYLTVALTTERIEITTYEGLLRTAESAGFGDDVTEPLTGVLEQERKTHRKLQGLAGGTDGQGLWEKLTEL